MSQELPIYISVPLEPTEAMIDAGLSATAAWLGIEGSALTVNREKMKLRYRAMVMAAFMSPGTRGS